MADRFRTALDWEDVRFFVALARHRSLSAAARALGVNHATVARRVAGLEAALGAPLFERRPDGYALTAAGHGTLEVAGAMEDAAEALPRRLQAVPRPPLAGLLRLTATPALAEAFLVPRLAAFQAQHPALDIELVADRRPMSLLRRETDIALRLGRPPADGELVARRLVAVRFAFYAAPAWRDRLARGEVLAFVGFDEANVFVPETAWLSRHFPTARVSWRGSSHAVRAAASRAGCGVALLPRFLGAADPGLVRVELGGASPPARTAWLLTRQDVRSVARIGLASDFLVDLFKRERPLFEGD